MSICTRFALALAVVLVTAPSARAQDAALAAPAAATGAVYAPAVTPVGPLADAAVVGVRHQAAADVTAPQRRRSSAQGTTLMIVGGAAFLAGLLIGGDAGPAIAIGGAGVGLYGLYQYLQ